MDDRRKPAVSSKESISIACGAPLVFCEKSRELRFVVVWKRSKILLSRSYHNSSVKSGDDETIASFESLRLTDIQRRKPQNCFAARVSLQLCCKGSA